MEEYPENQEGLEPEPLEQEPEPEPPEPEPEPEPPEEEEPTRAGPENDPEPLVDDYYDEAEFSEAHQGWAGREHSRAIGKPLEDDFDSYPDFIEALTDWKAEQNKGQGPPQIIKEVPLTAEEALVQRYPDATDEDITWIDQRNRIATQAQEFGRKAEELERDGHIREAEQMRGRETYTLRELEKLGPMPAQTAENEQLLHRTRERVMADPNDEVGRQLFNKEWNEPTIILSCENLRKSGFLHGATVPEGAKILEVRLPDGITGADAQAEANSMGQMNVEDFVLMKGWINLEIHSGEVETVEPPGDEPEIVRNDPRNMSQGEYVKWRLGEKKATGSGRLGEGTGNSRIFGGG